MSKRLLQRDEVLLLKVVGPAGETSGSFRWPLTVGTEVEASGRDARAPWLSSRCAWLWGAGDIRDAERNIDDEKNRWLVLKAKAADLVHLVDGVAVPRCTVVAVFNDKARAANFIVRHRPDGGPVSMFGRVLVGDKGRAIVGDEGQAVAGHKGRSVAGHAGQAIVGHAGEATVGNEGRAMAGNRGRATAGHAGHAFAGYAGQAVAGYAGCAVAGYAGYAIAGPDDVRLRALECAPKQ